MEIKCNTYPYYRRSMPTFGSAPVSGTLQVPNNWGSVDIYVKRPDVSVNASGLFGLARKVLNPVLNYVETYKKNIKHTYDHKIYYALIEKELYGKNTINSLTHDADKMILYILGFPKSFVTNFHRKHSEHHIESGKKINLKSMFCDLVASSPDFKPEKKYGLRDFYNKSNELKAVKGFKELLENYNFGENINILKIKKIRKGVFFGIKLHR